MRSLDTVLPDVRPEAPGCPLPVAKNAVRQAAGDFLRDTHAWHHTTEAITPQDSHPAVYTVDVPEGAIGLAVVRVARASEPDRPFPARFSPPDHVTVERADGPFEITLALELAKGASELPDWLLHRAHEAIAAGTKYRLLRMPNVEWSNPELGMFYRNAYREEVAAHRVEQARDYTQKPLRVKPVRFV